MVLDQQALNLDLKYPDKLHQADRVIERYNWKLRC